MVDLTEFSMRILRLYGPLALLLFTFLETSMLFPFLPSEIVVPAAAALIITDPLSFLLFAAAAAVGGTAGAFVPFYVFRDTRVGRSDWLTDFVRVSEDRIERGQAWFQRWGQSSVLWGRLLPVLRSVVSVPAGFADMHPGRFGAYTAVGTLVFYSATGALVYYARQESLFAAAFAFATRRPAIVAGGALLSLVIGAIAWHLFGRR